ncbi:hypothetical protein COO91_05645 [Nostoc flagelliforme CCNUN1]|uniref:Uncharacterized protein n=1 Tax=Nostoc flagelliforme CCNUN1 TaxID=2038116 RepID=A0A2K8SW50_9NOSO|nr:hypothetical protein COO91_05645 [Nostoc flagelliforme CCNUN1]
MLSLLYSLNSFYATIFFILQNAHNKQAILRKKHIRHFQKIKCPAPAGFSSRS